MSAVFEMIRVRGQVQGVGFRPAVARVAARLGLPGWVRNDADGVLIALVGAPAQRDGFVHALLDELPPLARVQELVRDAADAAPAPSCEGFEILASRPALDAPPTTPVAPDAAVCPACVAEVTDPLARRYRYPFTNCTHCGPRFSIAQRVPWDRARTTMAAFDVCAECQAEYDDLDDRRHHAEAIACHVCGPRASLSRIDRRPYAFDTLSMLDEVDAVATLLRRGAIVAVKGLGGFNLMVDATSAEAVARLRARKRRPTKPLALMVRDLEVAMRWCHVTPLERDALRGPAGPIVSLRARDGVQPEIVPDVAPVPSGAVVRYGVMLPSTPLHVLALRRVDRPVVCTSGNVSGQPQVIDDEAAFAELAEVADWVLGHDRAIHSRVDDSVVRVFGGRARVLRRARGLAPAALPLPPGFAAIAAARPTLALGGDLKAAVCLTRATDAVLSQHLGDLDDAAASAGFVEQCSRLRRLLEHEPACVVVDNHPDSRAAAHAFAIAAETGATIERVAHHHAHFAACLGENGVPLGAPAVLGLVLDGTGVGLDDTSSWGAELLVGSYAEVRRVATLKPIALLGGDRAAREPWRCLYAHLRAEMGWGELLANFGDVDVVARLRTKPVELLEQMLTGGVAAPRASSGGRLFDAVAAALGLCFEAQDHEAQAATMLEALVTDDALAQALQERDADEVYPLTVPTLPSGLPYLEPLGMWRALLGDLATDVAPSLVAARFHVALALGLARLCDRQAASPRDGAPRQVALSGGCFQNAVLHTRTVAELERCGFEVLSHAEVPTHDGGLAFGQALVALARAAGSPRRGAGPPSGGEDV